MASAQTSTQVFIYGGRQGKVVYRDLLVIDKGTNTLELRYDYTQRGHLPLNAPPETQAAALSASGANLYLFGGRQNDIQGPLNTLWTFDLDQETWVGATSVLRPHARSGFSMAAAGDSDFVIFGGLATVGRSYLTNDMWMFRSSVSRWVRIVDHQLSAQSPAPRAHGGLVVYKTDVYVFGGSMDDGVTDYKLWKCDIAAFMQGSSEEIVEWQSQTLQSSLGGNQHLLQRSMFSAAMFGSQIVAWGGQLTVEFDSAEDYKAVFSIDLDKKSISAQTVSGENPVPRTGHTTVAYQSSMCIHGGKDFKGFYLMDVWCYQVDKWTRASSSSSVRVYRYLAAAVVVGQYMVVSGGFDQQGKRVQGESLWSFAESDWLQTVGQVDASLDLGQGVAGHASVQTRHGMFAFGGETDHYASNQLVLVQPGLSRGTHTTKTRSTRQVQYAQDPSGALNYPPGTVYRLELESATAIILNVTISEGDRVSIYEGSVSAETQAVDIIRGVAVNLVKTFTTSPVTLVLQSTGRLNDTFRSDAKGFQVAHAVCPSGAVSSVDAICACAGGFYEDAKTAVCAKCLAESDDPACVGYVDEGEGNITLIAGVVGGVVGGLVLIGAIFGKKYRDKMKHMQSREQALYMHVKFNELEFGKALGAGSFGEVFAGSWRGSEVAIKKLNFSKITKEALAEFDHEVSVMVELRHPNLVLYMAACVEPPNLCIVSELMQRGSLYDALHDERLDLDMSMKISFLADAAKGLQYLHMSSPPILHRDLKSPNLLLDGKWNLKISDFGLSGVSLTRKDGDAPPGTLLWMAPEVIRGHEYTKKADIYSYAVIMWEVFTRQEPYQGELVESVTVRVSEQGLRPDLKEVKDANEAMKELMVTCWSPKPDDRPEFAEIAKSILLIQEKEAIAMARASQMQKSQRSQSYASFDSPTGNVAFVFTDVQSSTSLWEQHSDHMGEALHLHNELIRGVIARHKGYEVKTEGDAFMVTFSSVEKAMLFTLQCQEMLVTAEWPESILSHPSACRVQSKNITIFNGLRVRMGIHWGEPICKEDPITGRMDYFGQVVNKAARVGGFPKGGQIAISDAAYEQIIDKIESLGSPRIRDLGEHTLKGISTPVKLYEVLPLSLSDRAIHFETRANSSTSLSPFTGNTMSSDDGSSRAENDSWQVNFDDIKLLGKELGAGSFGTVYLGDYMGEQVAVKKFMKQKMSEKQYFSFLSEIMILREVNHPNILRFIGASIKQPNICLLLEYASHGSLRDVLSASKSLLSFGQQMGALCQVAEAMAFLHNRKPSVIHRDLKSANVMVMSLDPIKIKIGDFGLARIKSDNQTMTKCGTRAWLAPEVLKGARYDETADVFSYGVMMWEVITRDRPYTNIDPMKLNFEIMNGLRPAIPKSLKQSVATLMGSCWDADAKKRPSFDSIHDQLKKEI
eukprot:TRINITY_DN233_c0_g2_i11.p1 TRINITY_DN233_c0_g2~~TRINITY_DN233_c0_g2_i11.p1  ORF type:complete len:1491 (-),score=353.01 TRINITY_DN233_c0_g2_i11:2172-6428(-)